MAKQVRVRRDTLTNINAVVPADGEIAYNLTDDRIHMGDGATAGGIPHANFRDIQKKKFDYAADTGAANAYVVALSYSPGSYATPLTFKFKATNSNTGASTINVNGLGTKNIYKYIAGTLGNLTANDIIAGGIYELTYDGTQFQLQTYANAGLLTVKQGDLATSTGTVSSNGGFVTLPGGEYGFFPQMRYTSVNNVGAMGVMASTSSSFITGMVLGAGANDSGPIPKILNTSSLGGSRNIPLIDNTNGGSAVGTAAAQQRYVTSSPPFSDVRFGGDGAGFFFALLDSSGEIISHYFADVPPWAYNGPTNIRADKICPLTGKKFRNCMKKRSFEEIMSGAPLEYEMEEITQEIKNADMDLIPHPFGEVPPGHTVVLLDPTDDRIARMVEYQNIGGSDDIIEQITRGFIQVDNGKISRKGLKKDGFALHRLKFKYSGKGN